MIRLSEGKMFLKTKCSKYQNSGDNTLPGRRKLLCHSNINYLPWLHQGSNQCVLKGNSRCSSKDAFLHEPMTQDSQGRSTTKIPIILVWICSVQENLNPWHWCTVRPFTALFLAFQDEQNTLCSFANFPFLLFRPSECIEMIWSLSNCSAITPGHILHQPKIWRCRISGCSFHFLQLENGLNKIGAWLLGLHCMYLCFWSTPWRLVKQLIWVTMPVIFVVIIVDANLGVLWIEYTPEKLSWAELKRLHLACDWNRDTPCLWYIATGIA